MTSVARTPLRLSLLASALLFSSSALAQDLGHKIVGTLGLEAGNAPATGIYVADRFVYYASQRLFDRNGNALPIQGLDIDVLADAVGAAVTQRIPRLAATYTVAAAMPVAHVSLNSDQPFASIDRFGIGDVFVQPAKLGWRLPNLDAVASYEFYVPTGWYDPTGRHGVSSGQWTNEFSLGGTLYFDRQRSVYLSALASYDTYGPKQGIDITRGDTLQVQGGLGVRLLRLVDVGLAGYALWQMRDDRGAALPPALRDARERVFGFGPDVGVSIPRLRVRAGLRYEHDVGVRSRPEGEVLVCSLTWRAAGVPAQR